MPSRGGGPLRTGVEGVARADPVTKRLVERLQPGEIAAVDHPDMDRLAAESLVERRPAAVLNASPFLTGRFPAEGPWLLWEAGIPMVEQIPGLLAHLREGDAIRVEGATVLGPGWQLQGVPVTREALEARWHEGRPAWTKSCTNLLKIPYSMPSGSGIRSSGRWPTRPCGPA